MNIEYMSPELLEGYKPNKTADWWSLGCLMYFMFIILVMKW